MHYFIFAGELSGDELGYHLVQDIKRFDSNPIFSGWGGERMKSAGVQIKRGLEQLQIMGFKEVISRPIFIHRLIREAKKEILLSSPDVIIFIDFGGFNLNMAKWAHRNRFKTVYHVPPKVWASRGWRIRTLQSSIDLVSVIFPFEAEFYRHKGLEVSYSGNPWFSQITRYTPSEKFRESHGLNQDRIASIFPGSRKKEIKAILPIVIKLVTEFPEFQWCVSCANSLSPSFLMHFIPEEIIRKVHIIEGQTYDLLAHSEISVITSGTASFEASLFKVPHIIAYKTNWFNYIIARLFILISHISLVNISLNEAVLPELIQHKLTLKNLSSTLRSISRPDSQRKIQSSFDKLQLQFKSAEREINIGERIVSLAQSEYS